MQCLYQNILKEGNDYHEYLRCPNLLEKNFEFLRSEIVMEKVDLICAETVKATPTGSDSVFITYSKTIKKLVYGKITVAVL